MYIDWTEEEKQTTVCIIQITSRCTHFGFHQDKTSIKLLVEREQSPTDHTRKQEKDFLFPPFLLDQDNIYRDAKLPHLSKK